MQLLILIHTTKIARDFLFNGDFPETIVGFSLFSVTFAYYLKKKQL